MLVMHSKTIRGFPVAFGCEQTQNKRLELTVYSIRGKTSRVQPATPAKQPWGKARKLRQHQQFPQIEYRDALLVRKLACRVDQLSVSKSSCVVMPRPPLRPMLAQAPSQVPRVNLGSP